MRLHEDACFFLVGLAQVLAGFDCLCKTRLQVAGLFNPRAVRAPAAEIRETVALRTIEAVHRPSQHQRERVLTTPVTSGQHNGMWKMIARQHLAQAANCLGVTVKVRKHSVVMSYERGAIKSSSPIS